MLRKPAMVWSSKGSRTCLLTSMEWRGRAAVLIEVVAWEQFIWT